MKNKEEPKKENKIKEYFKKTISLYFLTIFLFLAIFLLLTSNLPNKLKNYLSITKNFKALNSNLDFLKNAEIEKRGDLKEKFNSSIKKIEDIKDSILTESKNFIQKVENIKDDIVENINKILQKNIQIPESFYFYSKNPTKIYIQNEDAKNLYIDWGDGSEENIKFDKEKTITHFWEKTGKYKVKIKILKDKNLLKEINLNLIVE